MEFRQAVFSRFWARSERFPPRLRIKSRRRQSLQSPHRRRPSIRRLPILSSAKSAPPSWAGASTTLPWSRAIPTPFTSAPRRAASGRRRMAESAGSRSSTTKPFRRSEPSRWRRPIHRIVWVGTGEANNRQSSSWGNGIYKSTDAGKTWKHMGLDATQHIGRIAIHPRKSRHRVCGGARPPVGAESGARALQDDRRRKDVEAGAEHQRRHRRGRRSDGSAKPRHALRRGLRAAPHPVRL